MTGGVPAAEWDVLVHDFLEGSFEARPDLGTRAGRHEFGGRLPDWSSEGLEREVARLRAARARALAFGPTALDRARLLERAHLLSRVDGELFWLETLDEPRRNPAFYASALDPNVYVAREYAALEDRLRAYTRYAAAVPPAAERIRENLRGPLPATFVEIGRTTFGGLAAFYERDVPAAFAAVEDASLQAAFRKANARAADAMRELDRWLESRRGEEAAGFALGSDRFAKMLRTTEGLDLPLAEVERVGRDELERNLTALREACDAFAPGVDPAACIARTQARKPAEGPVAAARRQLARLHEFVGESQLVTLPAQADVRVETSPPYMRWNAAYIDIPGPYEEGLPATYYIAPPDPAWSAAEREAYLPGEAELLFISAHEVWPGHYLHFLHAHRARSPLARVFVGYAFSEGWAHYAEELVWEAGLGEGDAEIRIGQLQNALLRNVRYLCAIGMHARGMSLQEAERAFREQAFLDRANARQQAARGTFDPAYLNYTLGKLLIRRLREDWTPPRGGRAAWRTFHDELLSFGGPPLPLVREALLGGAGGPVL